jgi:hypothetical protein
LDEQKTTFVLSCYLQKYAIKSRAPNNIKRLPGLCPVFPYRSLVGTKCIRHPTYCTNARFPSTWLDRRKKKETSASDADQTQSHVRPSSRARAPQEQNQIRTTVGVHRRANEAQSQHEVPPSTMYLVCHRPDSLEHDPEHQAPGHLFVLQAVKDPAERLASCRLAHDAHQRCRDAAPDEQPPSLDA